MSAESLFFGTRGGGDSRIESGHACTCGRREHRTGSVPEYSCQRRKRGWDRNHRARDLAQVGDDDITRRENSAGFAGNFHNVRHVRFHSEDEFTLMIRRCALFDQLRFEISKMDGGIRQRVVVGRESHAVDDACRRMLGCAFRQLCWSAPCGLRHILRLCRDLLCARNVRERQQACQQREFQAKSHDVIVLPRCVPFRSTR